MKDDLIYKTYNKEYNGISFRAQKLLNSQESYILDYKESIDSLQCRDLVAFANSKYGGTILVGVKEDNGLNGIQRGKIIGCPVGDTERLKIINKAQACIPEIDLAIIIENLDKLPFIRIEISSGKFKPYCTSNGLYMIRGDGRNNPLTPNALLNIIMEEQGKEFISKFDQATRELDWNLNSTKKRINDLNNNIGAINFLISEYVGDLISNILTLTKELGNEKTTIEQQNHVSVL
ncbi:ATP-binding protein [bacterium]|nr:ATP-binding protein [bacterium]